MMADMVLDRLIADLRARAALLDGQARPVAILWTDPKREWLPLVDLLLQNIDEYLVLGDYAPARRTGPAVWVRCVVDGRSTSPLCPTAAHPSSTCRAWRARISARAGSVPTG